MTFSDVLASCRERYRDVSALMMKHGHDARHDYDFAASFCFPGMSAKAGWSEHFDGENVVVAVLTFPHDTTLSRRCEATGAYTDLESAYSSQYNRDLTLDLWSGPTGQRLYGKWYEDGDEGSVPALTAMIRDLWGELERVSAKAKPSRRRPKSNTMLGRSVIPLDAAWAKVESEGARVATEYAELYKWADKLSKVQRTLVKYLIEGGGKRTLADVLAECEWNNHKAFESTQSRVNKKLRKHKWRIESDKPFVNLVPFGTPSKK